MKTLFLKSNLLHIRTNEGEFEVSNPDEIGYFNSTGMFYIWNSGNGDRVGVDNEVEWPYGIEFETIAPHPECNKARECLQLTNGLNCSQAYDARTRSTSLCAKAYKLARLIPKEEFKPAQPTPNFPKGGTTFTESGYKEFEPLSNEQFNSPENQNRDNAIVGFRRVESSEPQEKADKSITFCEKCGEAHFKGITHICPIPTCSQCKKNPVDIDTVGNVYSEICRECKEINFKNLISPVSAPSESQEEHAKRFAEWLRKNNWSAIPKSEQHWFNILSGEKLRTTNDLYSDFTRNP